MGINEAGSYHVPDGVDHSLRLSVKAGSDGCHAVTFKGHVGDPPRSAASIDEGAASDQQ
jgi:hypothetical protein